MTNSMLSSSTTMALPPSLPPLAMVSNPSPKTPKTLSKYSKSIPFLRRPPQLTSTLAGDVGFDPLNFASTQYKLLNYREAEIKHSRLAMLAAVGWPVSELFDAKITQVIDADFGLDLQPVVDGNDRVPSLLNGGLDNVSPVFWGACIGLTAAIDIKGIQNTRYNDSSVAKAFDEGSEYIPGDYKFDPLGLYPKDVEGRERMQLAEIKHGRLGMIAITAFAVQEAVSHVGVVDETPMFFRPFHF